MKNEQGFTLIEVLIAGAILVIVLLGVAAMTLSAYGQLSRSGEQTVATTLSQQRIEWLRNQGYASSDLNAGTTVETLGATYAGYTRTSTVMADTPRSGVKQVTVRTVAPSGLAFEVVSLVGQ